MLLRTLRGKATIPMKAIIGRPGIASSQLASNQFIR
jgi:hypothetical protein